MTPTIGHASVTTAPGRKKGLLSLALIILSIIVVAASGTLTWYILATHKETDANHKIISENITKDVSKQNVLATQKKTDVQSSLGFSLSFDPTQIVATGQVTDSEASRNGKVYWEEFTDKELSIQRPYSIVKFRPDSDSPTSPTLMVSTNIRKSFWDAPLADPANESKTKLDILKDIIINGRVDEETKITSSETMVINDLEYLHVTTMRDNTSYGVASGTRDDYYFTVQNDRPYWAVMTNSHTDVSIQSAYEYIISTLSYNSIDTNLLGSTQSQVSLASTELPEDTSYTPGEIDDETIVDVILKNQPATVRIASISCGAVSLTKQETTVTFDYTCAGGVGSGSIISSDGYIATNGHVVTITKQSLLTQSLNSVAAVQKLVSFLTTTQLITAEQGNRLIDGVRSGETSALNALQQISNQFDDGMISVSRNTAKYGVQISNQPIRFDTNKEDISYNDYVVPAKLVASDYDAANAQQVLEGKTQEFTHSDVAILKASGNFPTVELGDTNSLSSGNMLTAIGFPGFIDGNLSTEQWQTVPTITQGKVIAITEDAYLSGRRLITTTVQIAPGNSGGPAFNNDGKQVGLNTYGVISCPDKQCFGNGTVRDIADIKKLAAKHNITLKQGELTKHWHTAIDSYESGDYKEALKLFDIVKREYPANYFAPELSRSARAQIGSDTDTSDNGSLAFIVTMIVIMSVGLLAITTCVVLLIRANHHAPVINQGATF